MVEIVPDIHLADGSAGGNMYLPVDGITLVDMGAARGHIPDISDRAGYSPHDIKMIIITWIVKLPA
ncbi:MAG: hypothetical protein ACM3QV_00245 [Caulobacteraceae bacterium]